jgi:hypothetical protein
MTIRLQVSAPTGTSFAFEHRGPTIRVGRDPSVELALKGDDFDSVSWHHARIELSPAGAYVSDVKSTNGTFVNFTRVDDRTKLQEGDQIQLGYTGPGLKVLGIDLAAAGPERAAHTPAAAAPRREAPARAAAPPPAAAPRRGVGQTTMMLMTLQRSQRNMMIGFGVLGVALVLLAGIFLYSRRDNKPAGNDQAGVQNNSGTSTTGAGEGSTGTSGAGPAGTGGAQKPGTEGGAAAAGAGNPPSTGQPPVMAVSAERRPIGRYPAIPKQAPSVLLQRQRDPDPWAKLRPEDAVYSGNYLLSLPGYRSTVYLENGTHLTLWGNIPEFSNFPPVLESTVLLLVPPPGMDVDMTLDRGRVRIANYKQKGEVHARVRFQQEVWDLTLPDNSSEVVLELWGLFPRDVPFSKEPGGKGPVICLGLFTKGRAGLSTGGRKYELADATQLTWTNRSPTVVGPDPLKQLPAWWSDRIEQTPQAADKMIALTDLADLLSKHDDVTATIVARVQESQEQAERVLGVLFLGALDAIPYLIDALREKAHPEVRNAAVFALRHWMSRGHDYELEVFRDFEKKAYSQADAEIIMRLLHSFSDEELKDPKTFAFLLGCLDHERLVVRDLAFQHLALLVPDGATTIQYDPNAEPDKRKPAVEQWKKLIPEGKVPANLAVGPAGKPKEGP